MFPILIPNVGFKKFAEIKPNEGIQFRKSLSFDVGDKITNLSPTFLKISSPTKLNTWLTNIRADTNSIQAIHKTRNYFEDVKKDYFFKETYTGIFKDLRFVDSSFFSTRSSVSRKYCAIWCSINNTKRRSPS